jgi:ElaB/YqjD/DUF883 family membrane-anchored ribosome-binding protein
VDEKPDVIRHEIEETRQSLSEKLETLEGQVKETISSVTGSVEETVEKVKATVSDTVETVKSSVEGTVESVKRTFDLAYQVDRHPWAMAGCSLLAGVAAGYLLGGPRGRARHRGFGRQRTPSTGAFGSARSFAETPGYQAASAYSAPADNGHEHQGPGFLSQLLAPLAPEIDKIKGTAVAAVMGMVRDSLVRAVPPALAENVRDIMDDLTRKAGGHPIREPILPSGSTSGGYGSTGSTPAL